MFPWMMPGAGAGNLSLLSLMMGGGLNGTLSGGGGSASFTSNPQAWARMFSGTSSWRGTRDIAASTRGSAIPRPAICSRTIRARASA